MSFLSTALSGTLFRRGSVTLTNTPPKGETNAFRTSYILLGATRTGLADSCRVRLYATSGSVDVDESRPTSSFDYSASVALNLDMQFSPNTQSITFDPPIVGTTFTTTSMTYYNIESVSSDAVTFTYYPIELTTGSRSNITIPTVTLVAGATASGELSSPKSFILLNAKSEYADTRLRLYSKPIAEIDSSELNRPYSASFNSGSHLIVDMLFDSASYTYIMTPILQGFNLESYTPGVGRVGYVYENLSTSTITNTFAAVGIYPLEN